jgi:hypothetical protein
MSGWPAKILLHCLAAGKAIFSNLSPQELILLQNPPSQNREDLSKTVSEAVGIGNNPKIVS